MKRRAECLTLVSIASGVVHPLISTVTGVNSNSLELFAIDRPGIVGYYCLKKLAVCPPAVKALNV